MKCDNRNSISPVCRMPRISALANVFFLVMPHLVGQYRDQFVSRVLLYQGVKQYNSSVFAETGKKGI